MRRRPALRFIQVMAAGGALAAALGLSVASANHGAPHGLALGHARKADLPSQTPANASPAQPAAPGAAASAGAPRSAAPGQAKKQVPGPVRNASGQLTAVSGNAPGLTLTVKTAQTGDVKVVTAASTAFRGANHKAMTLGMLASLRGRMVNVHGRVNANGELVATHIIVRPEGSGADD